MNTYNNMNLNSFSQKRLDFFQVQKNVNAKRVARLNHFQKILEQIHQKILSLSQQGLTRFTYSIPLWKWGEPLYDLKELVPYLIYQLTQNGMLAQSRNQNELYISWDLIEIKTYQQLYKQNEEQRKEQEKRHSNILQSSQDVRDLTGNQVNVQVQPQQKPNYCFNVIGQQGTPEQVMQPQNATNRFIQLNNQLLQDYQQKQELATASLNASNQFDNDDTLLFNKNAEPEKLNDTYQKMQYQSQLNQKRFMERLFGSQQDQEPPLSY